MKAIIIAYACHPFLGSEEGVGYSYVLSISRFCKCDVITSDQNRKFLENLNLKNIKWIFIKEDNLKNKLKFLWKFIANSPLRPLLAFSYSRWQKKAERHVNFELKKHHYDIVHRLTYVGYRFPFNLENKNVPLLFGPIGGTENLSFKHLLYLDFGGIVYFSIRTILNTIQLNFSYAIKKSYKKSNCNIISSHSGIYKDLIYYFNKKSDIMSEICISANKYNFVEPKKLNENLKVVWIGNFEPAKNLPPLLHAKASLEKKNIFFDLIICGSGSRENKWKKISRKLKLKNIYWKGRIERDQVLKILSNSHVYITTSLKDLTSTSLIEAMWFGCAIISTPLNGFIDALKGTKNFFISLEDKKAMTESIENHILYMIVNEKKRFELAQKNIIRSDNFSTDFVSQKIENIYRRLIK